MGLPHWNPLFSFPNGGFNDFDRNVAVECLNEELPDGIPEENLCGNRGQPVSFSV
jgi:hypothetical protein